LLLEWVTEADFTKELNLATLAMHPFNLAEEELDIPSEEIMKIIKV